MERRSFFKHLSALTLAPVAMRLPSDFDRKPEPEPEDMAEPNQIYPYATSCGPVFATFTTLVTPIGTAYYFEQTYPTELLIGITDEPVRWPKRGR